MVNFSINQFLEFEELNNLFELSFNGWYLWPYIRLDVYNALLYRHSNSLGEIRERKAKITLKKTLRVIQNCSIKNPILVARKKSILIFSNQIRNFDDGKYKCRITDDIASALSDEAACAELIFEMELGHMEPLYTKNVLYCDYLDVIPTILTPIYKYIEKDRLQELERLCKKISIYAERYFGYTFDFDKVLSRTISAYMRWKTRKKLFKHLFKKISPKVLVEVCSYSISRMIMNEVAHECGIKVVELQHGVISPGHIAYNFSTRRNNKCYPDYLFVFSDFWKSYAKYIQEANNIIPVGYPYFELMMSKYPHKSSTDGIIRIIVISQHIFTDRLVDDILQLTDTLDTAKRKYHLIYKTHPRETIASTQNNRLWKKATVELVDNPGANLYECFSRSDIQIGVSSSALYEGLGYGLRTFVMNYDTADLYMGPICKQKKAIMVSNGVAAAECIINEEFPEKDINGLFFMPNSINNCIDAIHRIEKDFQYSVSNEHK